MICEFKYYGMKMYLVYRIFNTFLHVFWVLRKSRKILERYCVCNLTELNRRNVNIILTSIKHFLSDSQQHLCLSVKWGRYRLFPILKLNKFGIFPFLFMLHNTQCDFKKLSIFTKKNLCIMFGPTQVGYCCNMLMDVFLKLRGQSL